MKSSLHPLLEVLEDSGTLLLTTALLLLVGGFIALAVGLLVKQRHQESRKRVEHWLEEARLLLNSASTEDVNNAVKLLDLALEETPPWWDPPLVELKTRALMRLHRYEDVLKLLHAFLPNLEIQTKLTNGAESNWQTKAALQREGFWRVVLLGQACYHLGRLEEALVLLQRAKWHSRITTRNGTIGQAVLLPLKEDGFALNVESGAGLPLEALNRLIAVIKFLVRRTAAGEAAFSAGLYAEAVRQYSRVLDSRKGTPRALAAELYLRRAAAHKKLSRFPEAIADCNRAFALEPKLCRKAIWMRAMLYNAIGCYSESARDLRKLLLVRQASAAVSSKSAMDFSPLSVAFNLRKMWWKQTNLWWKQAGVLFMLVCECSVLSSSRAALWVNIVNWFAVKRGSYAGRMMLDQQWASIVGKKRKKTKKGGGEWETEEEEDEGCITGPPIPKSVPEIETCLRKMLEKETDNVEFRKVLLGKEPRVTEPPGKELAERIESAFRVLMLRHDPSKAVQFLERCTMDDAAEVEEVRKEIVREGERLLRVLEEAREVGANICGGKGAKVHPSDSETEVEPGACSNPDVPSSSSSNSEDATCTEASVCASDVAGEENQTELCCSSQEPSGRVPGSHKSSSKSGENRPSSAKTKRDLTTHSRHWMRRLGAKGFPDERRTVSSRLTGMRMWREEPAPLSAGEYDSLLMGFSEEKPVGGGLLDEPSLGVLGSLENLTTLDSRNPTGRERGRGGERERERERDVGKLLVKGFKGVFAMGGGVFVQKERGQEREKKREKRGSSVGSAGSGKEKAEKSNREEKREGKEGKEGKEKKDSREGNGGRERKEGKEAKEGKEGGKDGKDGKEGRGKRTIGKSRSEDAKKGNFPKRTSAGSSKSEKKETAVPSLEGNGGFKNLSLNLSPCEGQSMFSESKKDDKARDSPTENVFQRSSVSPISKPLASQLFSENVFKKISLSRGSPADSENIPRNPGSDTKQSKKQESEKKQHGRSGKREGSTDAPLCKGDAEEILEKERLKAWKRMKSKVGAMAAMGAIGSIGKSPKRSASEFQESSSQSKHSLGFMDLGGLSLSPLRLSPRFSKQPLGEASEKVPDVASKDSVTSLVSPTPLRPPRRSFEMPSALPVRMSAPNSLPCDQIESPAAMFPRSASVNSPTLPRAHETVVESKFSSTVSAPVSPTFPTVANFASGPLNATKYEDTKQESTKKAIFRLTRKRSKSLEKVITDLTLPQIGVQEQGVP